MAPLWRRRTWGRERESRGGFWLEEADERGTDAKGVGSSAVGRACQRRRRGREGRRGRVALDSRLEGGVNRAKLKFTNINTTTSRVSVRNINESAREGAKQIASK
jgi:hypothetical protein